MLFLLPRASFGEATATPATPPAAPAAAPVPVSADELQLRSLEARLVHEMAAQIEQHKLRVDEQVEKAMDKQREFVKYLTTEVLGFIATAAIGLVLVAGFLGWHFGESRRVAIEIAVAEAVSAAEAETKEKIAGLVVPERVVTQARASVVEAAQRLDEVKRELLAAVTRDFESARDEALAVRAEWIEKMVGEGLTEKLKEQLDVVKRMDSLEARVAELAGFTARSVDLGGYYLFQSGKEPVWVDGKVPGFSHKASEACKPERS